MKEEDIRNAYVRIRTIDHTIPDDVLDFMKDASISALSAIKEQVDSLWVKAVDRLPALKGKSNSVVIRCTAPNHEFVTTGFRNYSEDSPALYMEVGNLSFLTVEDGGNYHSTVPARYIEWLEEKPRQEQVDWDEAIKKFNNEVADKTNVWVTASELLTHLQENYSLIPKPKPCATNTENKD